MDFYRSTAEAAGRQVQHDPLDQGTPDTTAGLCVTRGGDGEALLLTVQFTSAEELKFEHDHDAGPEFDSGSGFEVEVGSETGICAHHAT
ncbi:hypothetical protein J3A78_000261 [Streptomyces sp. PvR006]|uniref:hypothetical protein n=1 Tax=Streptomyces sp. PvR006 TaxID=2817860 RepID=UPI001AE51417|nr:hypothetical protein [Streptomyces sp. PvR006]MBP2579783.1 hypothetical protein [Streptomyces sp. PvR006]